jgi:hypothetical protein
MESSMSSPWSEWQIAQLNECLMQGIGPAEAAALIGKTREEVWNAVLLSRLIFYEHRRILPRRSEAIPRASSSLPWVRSC